MGPQEYAEQCRGATGSLCGCSGQELGSSRGCALISQTSSSLPRFLPPTNHRVLPVSGTALIGSGIIPGCAQGKRTSASVASGKRVRKGPGPRPEIQLESVGSSSSPASLRSPSAPSTRHRVGTNSVSRRKEEIHVLPSN